MQGTLPASNLISPGVGGPTDPSHDEDLRRGVLHTDIARPVAWLLVVGFLAAIVAIPLGQAYIEQREDEESPLWELFRRAPSAEHLRRVEHDLEAASYVKAYVQPRVQLLLTRFGRVGNKRAVVGHDGFLYYMPGVLHVGGPGFLDRDAQRSRQQAVLDSGEPALQADPRPAILAFHRALAVRGIRLVVMPIVDKASAQAEHLHTRGRSADLPDNPDFTRLLEELRASGVAVFDVRRTLPPPGAEPAFLQQDTHWTPAWMQQVARSLSLYVTTLVSLPPSQSVQLHAAVQPASRLGDLVDMLKLPDEQTLFRPQSVLVQQVQDAQNAPWEPDANADVLLLGDSFTNIFSLEGMGWGTAAGLGPHLALALGRAVDVIAQNDSGAFATRQALARELAAGSDRLQGKRVVIWEFAARELSAGDWKHIDWARPGSKESP
jgi:alginate O-acetyltransferase complex protein AlgJ